MKTTSEFLLTFLLNAFWQIALIAVVALLADRLLRRTPVRYRHFLWTAALGLSILLPFLASVGSLPRDAQPALLRQEIVREPILVGDLPASNVPVIANSWKSVFQISSRVAFSLLAVYLLFLGYRSFRFLRAWAKAQVAKRDACSIAASDRINTIVADCQRTIGVKTVGVASSASLRAPATVGIFRPLVILPEVLLREADHEALTAAIGHELVHVWRRDYLLNLIYEIIFLPLSFHPAAALMRRRITQTRELRCDELVAELLLQPEVYARSLVQLAASAMPLTRRARTVAVGVADADILEVRIMSLLKGRKLNSPKKRFWLIAAALLLAVPCISAASFGFHLNIAAAQEPSRETQEKNELRSRREQEIREKMQRQAQELEERIKTETNAEVKAKLERELDQVKERMDKPIGTAVTSEGNNYVWLAVDERRAREEREMETKRNAVLASLTKISMDQAIQIATSQNAGKVLQCTLVGEHWESPGELAKPSLVLYNVVILSGDDAKPTTTHVLVNAVDGTIFRNSKEERRRL